MAILQAQLKSPGFQSAAVVPGPPVSPWAVTQVPATRDAILTCTSKSNSIFLMLSIGFVTESYVLGKVFPTQADSNKCQQNIREGTTPGDDAPKWDGQIKPCICHAQVQVPAVSV